MFKIYQIMSLVDVIVNANGGTYMIIHFDNE